MYSSITKKKLMKLGIQCNILKKDEREYYTIAKDHNHNLSKAPQQEMFSLETHRALISVFGSSLSKG